MPNNANHRLEEYALRSSAWTLERDMNAMRFRAKYVSASENGDYYQVAFENRDAASDEILLDGFAGDLIRFSHGSDFQIRGAWLSTSCNAEGRTLNPHLQQRYGISA